MFKQLKKVQKILNDINDIRRLRHRDVEYVTPQAFNDLKAAIQNESIRKKVKDEINMGDYILKPWNA